MVNGSERSLAHFRQPSRLAPISNHSAARLSAAQSRPPALRNHPELQDVTLMIIGSCML